jgi:uncharacterized protein YdeI (YjbR/CyaY-like superfamily)
VLDGPQIRIESLPQWEQWLSANAAEQTEIWAVILKKSTGRQQITFEQLLEEAICWGWIDVKTKRVDDDWYGIRFVPRRPHSNWTPGNRDIACKLIAAGRMQPAGTAKLPSDLICA